jgi:hypothetical protein
LWLVLRSSCGQFLHSHHLSFFFLLLFGKRTAHEIRSWKKLEEVVVVMMLISFSFSLFII